MTPIAPLEGCDVTLMGAAVGTEPVIPVEVTEVAGVSFGDATAVDGSQVEVQAAAWMGMQLRTRWEQSSPRSKPTEQ